MLPDVWYEPILVSNPIGDKITEERVYKNCPIHIFDRVTHADLVESIMLYFNIILCMDWLHNYYGTIDCQNRVVRFKFQDEFEWESELKGSSLVGQIVSHLKVNKMIAKGYLYHLVRVND